MSTISETERKRGREAARVAALSLPALKGGASRARRRDLVEKCKTAAKAARDAHIDAPLSRCYGVIVDAVLSVVADELRVPTSEMIDAAIYAYEKAPGMMQYKAMKSALRGALSVSPLMKDEL